MLKRVNVFSRRLYLRLITNGRNAYIFLNAKKLKTNKSESNNKNYLTAKTKKTYRFTINRHKCAKSNCKQYKKQKNISTQATTILMTKDKEINAQKQIVESKTG